MIRYASHLMTAVLLTCGMAAIAPATARGQDATLLPEQAGPVTLVGCFLHEQGGKHDRYVLANPRIGPVASVAEATCSDTGAQPVVKLTEVQENHLDASVLGRWIEINGKLGRPRDGDDLRKLHIESFSVVPVVVPRAAAVMPVPQQAIPEPPKAVEAQPAAPEVAVIAPAEEQVVATTGVIKRLPHTASSQPLAGLIGLLALATGLALRLLGRRRALGRG